MDLSVWLNFTSPAGLCFDLATVPIPGSPVSLSMIDALVEAHVGPRREEVTVLEIGSWCGLSTVTWGRALERIGVRNYTIYCVDIWHHAGDIRYDAEKLEIQRERNAFNHDIFKFNVQNSIGWSRVVELIGDSRVSLNGLRDGFFDIVYVDGHHGYDMIRSDIENAVRLCTVGGIICGDDYDCSPEMMRMIPDDAKQLDEYKMPGTDVGVHPGVVLAVDDLLGVPRPYGSFWAFTVEAPFCGSVVALDVSALPRRIPAFIPPYVRPRFEEHFAGPAGFLPSHPFVANMAEGAGAVASGSDSAGGS
jgi:predicted O-methyltransferase YrrM